jgi:hypothetical protein
MSIDQEYIRMMNEEIDGVISAGDAKKLASYVRSDPEAGRYYAELRTTVMAIDNTVEVEAPPELRERIFESVFGRSREEAAEKISERRTFWRSFVPIFAAGVAAGFILFAAIRQLPDRSHEEPGYGATIGAAQRENQAAERFDAFGVKGSVLPEFESGSVTVTIEIVSDPDASILLEFEEGTSFESIRSTEGAAYQMEVDEKSLLVVHQGEAEYILRFRSGGPAQLVIRINSGGQTVAAMRFAGAE